MQNLAKNIYFYLVLQTVLFLIEMFFGSTSWRTSRSNLRVESICIAKTFRSSPKGNLIYKKKGILPLHMLCMHLSYLSLLANKRFSLQFLY